jgi:chromosome segregation ATPase
MADEIQQLLKMVANLKITVDEGFERVDKKLEEHDEKFEGIEKEMSKLNKTQTKILNTMKVYEHDIENNAKHIERLENKNNYIIVIIVSITQLKNIK